jgi:hypothetical protein
LSNPSDFLEAAERFERKAQGADGAWPIEPADYHFAAAALRAFAEEPRAYICEECGALYSSANLTGGVCTHRKVGDDDGGPGTECCGTLTALHGAPKVKG